MPFIQLTIIKPEPERSFAFSADGALTVGRVEGQAALSIPDRFMAPVHFSIEPRQEGYLLKDLSPGVQKHPRCEQQCFLYQLRNAPCHGQMCGIHDMSSRNGLHINGKRVSEGSVQDGDHVVAGTTCLRVNFCAAQPTLSAPPARAVSSLALTSTQVDAALATLKQVGTTLFAIVDAASDSPVLDSVRVHRELYYSLYDGAEGAKLDDVAPYLVELAPESPLTKRLLEQHWGTGAMSLLTCRADFKAVRRHLRKFLWVENEQGKRMYFRFYDPRVLREFLPSCTPEECAEFMGPVSGFIVESDRQGSAWSLSFDGTSLQQQELRF